MPEFWVVNASPLIGLGKINYLELLMKLPDGVVVPSDVAEEIKAGPEGDAARLAIESGSFNLVKVSNPEPELAAWDLGRGETSVLAYALANTGWTAILDDSVARKCAHSFGIPVKGTLSVVILAKRRGLIPSASRVLHALQEAGLHLDERTVRVALRDTVGERW
jgi:predicted nucleic acid-binding protein